MIYPCHVCAGIGREPLRSLGTFGGQCQTCRGTGELRDKPCNRTERQILWYLTDSEYAEHTASNAACRREQTQIAWDTHILR
jgi:hypothetical protein